MEIGKGHMILSAMKDAITALDAISKVYPPNDDSSPSVDIDYLQTYARERLDVIMLKLEKAGIDWEKFNTEKRKLK